MRRRYVRYLSGILPAALVTLGLLLLPTAGTWGSREHQSLNETEQKEVLELRRTRQLRRAHAIERPADLSPFGAGFQLDQRGPDRKARQNLIETNLGYIDLKRPESGVLKRVPAALRAEAASLKAAGAKGRGHTGGINIVQLEASALDARGFDDVEKEIRSHARVLQVAPSRGLVVRVGSEADFEALVALPIVEAIGPYEPAYKVSPLVGRMPLMQPDRARSHELELIVSLWADADPTAARAFLESVAGKDKVTPWRLDGSAYEVKGPTSIISRIARDPSIRNIGERTEWMLTNSETPTTLMIGNSESSFGLARPYHDLGLDGGGVGYRGCANNPAITCSVDTDCPVVPAPRSCVTLRINNGLTAVPPQIVAVTDNGISVDAVHFSQTVTQVTTGAVSIGPTHRKVHSIQGPKDDGTSCDGVLYGSNTHGNVVAGIIAGAPGDFGITFTKAIDPSDGPPVGGISLDALARGARIIMQDAALPTSCRSFELAEVGGEVFPDSLLDRLNQAICPKDGSGTGLCASVIGGGNEVHLHVMPFGVPNFDNILGNTENGTYPVASREVDLFLVNNRDYLVFSPVGSQGNTVRGTNTEEVWPDLFNGTAVDNDPNHPSDLQIPPPATAKNVLTVGGCLSDAWTSFGDSNSEEDPIGFSSKGPATPSLRTAPLVMAPGTDGSGLFAYPLFIAAATNRSRDNDNDIPVEREVDDSNTGTSFSSGFAAAAGAIVRDYFAQGFYPTGVRTTADRMPTLSGALVRAALVASANFMEELDFDLPTNPDPPTTTEKFVFNARAVDLANTPGEQVGVIGNNVQGYGRIVLDHVLPIVNYPPTVGTGSPDTVEYPAAGLVIYDALGTGEPPIDNGLNTQTEKLVTVDGVNAVAVKLCRAGDNANKSCVNDTDCPGSTCQTRRLIPQGQLRIALSWPDPPSAVDSEGKLVNDLDLEVESPGEDNDITSVNDNEYYHGNVYISGLALPMGQWGQALLSSSTVRDQRNNIEAIHLSSFAGKDIPNQLVTGTWKVRVKRGSGGDLPGQISVINGPNEDLNNNGRRDSGEPSDGDEFLDAGGQPFALVIAGPVFGFSNAQCLGSGDPASCCTGVGTGTCDPVWNGSPHALPANVARLDKYQYSCSDQILPSVVDPNDTAPDVTAGVVFQVVDGSGAVQDEEKGFAFTETATGSHVFRTVPLPARLASPAIKNNGILEGDNGLTLIMTYTDAPGRPAEARARFQCTPNFITTAIDVAGQSNAAIFVGGGCDRDQYFDRSERVTYSIALQNFEKADDLNDVEATLSVSGPGASAITVLDSPKNVGRIPGGQATGLNFNLVVSPSFATQAQPVTLTLTLDTKARGVRINRATLAFNHVVNADKEALHYSTDYPRGNLEPNGGREVRDYNRNRQIDASDKLDPFNNVFWPDEDVTFSSMFVAKSVNGFISNILGEDINNDGDNTDPGEGDIIPNQALDKGFLVSTNPPDVHKVPWNFDSNGGGWLGLRHPDSKPGIAFGVANMWEYKTSGACGAQTTIFDNNPAPLFQSPGAAGMWHTGDTDPSTPSGQTCDEYPYPFDPDSPTFEELVFDILVSPIIAKVNQQNDALGFPYTVEFQRLGVNMNIQTADYAGGDIDFDSDVDRDQGNCILCQYFYYRFGDIYSLLSFNAYTYGIDPKSTTPQRTFGPLVGDADNSLGPGNPQITGDESGFTGFTDNSNQNSLSPIPPNPNPNFRAFPSPADPQVCVPGCMNPAVCCEQNTDAGPERSMDVVLLEYQDGNFYLSLGPGQGEPIGGFAPGPAGNRWQIGIGFWAMETSLTPNDSPTDYGFGVDDVVLEWDEVHPVPETTAACTKFGGPGQPAGQQCATLTVDRLALYECNETVGITVNDPRRAFAGNAQCVGAGNPSSCCTGAGTGTCLGSVTVHGVTDSDADPVPTGVVVAKHPKKSFSIPEVSPGLFRGNVVIGSLFNNTDMLFTNPGTDGNMTFYYIDPECDGDRDGTVGETSFVNLDNDNIAFPPDNCPFDYNPNQENGACQGDTTPAPNNKNGLPCLNASTCGTGTCFIDGDSVGTLCDNCTFVANTTQQDSDADDVGDACDFDDIDFDGVVNAIDNCPDVYNASQVRAGGSSTKGIACNDQNLDTDNDGIKDRLDNCVRTFNNDPNAIPPITPTDADGDGVGDACDGDCANPQQTTLAVGSCLRTNDLRCTSSAQCPVTGVCVTTPTRACTVNQDCPGKGQCERTTLLQCSNDGQCPITGTCSNNPTKVCATAPDCPGGTCQNIAQELCVKCGPATQETCQLQGVTHAGTCGTTEDDLDADAVTDAIDNCATIPNASILEGAVLQPDADQDGRGDRCDAPQTVDDDNSGIPDDVITFNTTITCKKLQLAKLVVLAVSVGDINGDSDPFADAGETARMSITVRNDSPFALTAANLVLGSTDPDVACITKSTIFVPVLAAGGVLDTATLGNPAGRFEYTISASASTTNPASPSKGDFFLSVVSAQVVGTTTPVPISTVIDLDLPTGGLPGKIDPDGIPNNADDGIWFENFDTDRDGTRACKLAAPQSCNAQTPCPTGQVCAQNQCALATTTVCTQDSGCGAGQICAGPYISISSLPFGTPGVLNDTQGVWVGTAPGGINALAGIGCSGFIVPPQDPACRIDPDNDMDWHIHCPAGECANGQGFVTPTDGNMAYSGHNSLHWGHHFDPATREADSYYFRQLAAFMTNPIDLTPVPGPGDLELSFFHIADMMDNNNLNSRPGQAVDFGDVHIQVFDPSQPVGSQWGIWDRLAPFQNVYDHISYIWSTFGTSPTYCILTPTDSGTAAPAPRGVRELLCYPNGIWSHCGNSRDQTDSGQCADGVPSQLGFGEGLWVQSKFSLANYLGQRVRIRWIAQSWEFDCCASSYYELGGIWSPQFGDEGWWVDDIRVSGVLQSAAQPPADIKTPGPATCPPAFCDPTKGVCKNGPTPGLICTNTSQCGSGGTCSIDGGFDVDLIVSDADGDGFIYDGETVTLSAAATSNPGGCTGGGVQFRFFKGAPVPANTVQDWSSDPTFIDNPTADAEYHVQARCSDFPGCISTPAAAPGTENIMVYKGDSNDLLLTLSTGPVLLTITARPQPPTMSGYDFFKQTNPPGGPYSSLACSLGGGTPVGQPVSVPDAAIPSVGTTFMYWVGHSSTQPGALTALGRSSAGVLRLVPPAAACP